MYGYADGHVESVPVHHHETGWATKADQRPPGSVTNAADVATAVANLLPDFADRAAEVDLDGELSGKSITQLIDAGVFRLLQPKWSGGFEAKPVELYDVVRSISRQCGSTGWVASVLAVTPWLLALFDERAQREVWTGHRDALICASYAPSGQLIPVDGGYELSGHWRSAASSAYASWAVLGGTVFAEGDRPVDLVSTLVPKSDYRIGDGWDALGLRGSGNNDIHVEKVFVPSHRTLRVYDVALQRGPGQKINPGCLYRVPFGPLFNVSFMLPLVGIAEGCLDAYLSEMRERSRLTFGGANRPAEVAHVVAARASAEIDATVLQLDRNIGDLYERARRRREITLDLRLRARRDSAMGAERAVAAIDLIFGAARGTALRRGTRIERSWRDAHTVVAHASNDASTQLALCGRGMSGSPVDEMLL